MNIQKKVIAQTVAILSISFSIFISSCRRSLQNPTIIPTPIEDPSLIDKSWLTGNPCKAPCWYGLVPGESSFEDALSVVDTLPFIVSSDDIYSIKQYYSETQIQEIYYFKCKEPKGANCVLLSFVEDTLVEIYLVTNFFITFSDVVGQIGAPDYLWAGPVTPEIINCDVGLIWLQRQMSISYSETARDSGRDLCAIIRDAGHKPPKDLRVFNVSYVLPEVFDSIPEPGWHYEWHGFIQP